MLTSNQPKTKRQDGDSNAAVSRPQIIFQNRQDINSSLYNFLTPNYPLDFNIESCDFFQKGLGVDSLLRDAESLDWAHDAQLVDASNGNERSYQHVSPKTQGVTDLPILVKSEFPFSGLCGFTPSDANANMTSTHHYPEHNIFNHHDLDALAFPIGCEHTSGEDSDQWARHPGSHGFLAHDGICSEDDIGLYFHD